MKKYLFTVLVAGAIGIGTGTAYCLSGDAENLSSLGMENLEALANNEGSGHEVVCNCKSNWFSKNVCSADGSGSYCGGDPCDQHDNNCR